MDSDNPAALAPTMRRRFWAGAYEAAQYESMTDPLLTFGAAMAPPR